MKVGGNESATKYFQSHGGTAALASKDLKIKYTSNAAAKYKDELKRRSGADARECVSQTTSRLLAKRFQIPRRSCHNRYCCSFLYRWYINPFRRTKRRLLLIMG